ncbi:MAG: ABC transporter ATP-binding protein/permease [Synergistaceae bacterium]|jgi:ATP-binding cassette subfamily B protein|nr:ABC transporter ATP-binding protein/permease [Synergistaceae bacterium]
MSYDEEIYDRPPGMKVWAEMLPFFMPFRGLLSRVCGFMLLCSAVDALIPIYQKYVIDSFIVPGRSRGMATLIALGAILMVARVFGAMLFTRYAIRVEMGFARDLKKACFDHLQTLSLSYYNTTPVGYIISRVMSDTDRIGVMLSWGLVEILWGASYIVFSIVSMLALDIRLGLWLVVMAPPMALITSWFQKRILRCNRAVRRTNSRITGSFNEGILGARTSKTLVIEDININEFGSLVGEMYGAAVRAARWGAIYTPIMLMFGAFAVAIILVKGSASVMGGLMVFGTLSALVSYAISIFEPIQQMALIFGEITATQANIERVLALLARRPEITDSPEVIERYGDSFNPRRENWEPIKGDIRFDDVSFRYPDGDGYVLEHFNLDIPAGSCVAIVGETGAGKSTLVNLVCRFYEPTSGRVLIDGRDYRERSQLWLHSNIGYVLQSPHLFSGSARENIRYGRLDATDEEVMEAARLVSADSVIAKLPGGMLCDVGEGGDRLSTGEKQLISFARAILANPGIFVFDEATSSIDTETERRIQRAITKVLQGRTSFLIAHRLSTITMADVILVVRDGKIIERGSHRELLKERGYYTQICAMQYENELIRRR